MASPARDRGAQPRGDGQQVRRRRVRAALRDPARIPRHQPARPDGGRRRGRLTVHRRTAQRGRGAPAGRRRHPRPARRPPGQRPVLGHHRRAKGVRARRGQVCDHGRGDRRRARPEARSCGAALLAGQLRGRSAGWRSSLLRPRLLSQGQRLLLGLGRDQPGPGAVRLLAGRPRLWPRIGGGARGRRPGGRVMTYTSEEMRTVTAARALTDRMTCFVGIGLPSEAANLARATHAPNLVLIYESGAIGAKPEALPLSIGDGILAETAESVVSVPEIFNYWLQPGRIDVGFLGAAQLDKFGNINSTMIGSDYADPRVRLPGAGGAPEIAAACKEVIVIIRQSRRTFVERVDFVTSVGFGAGHGNRQRLGLTGAGPRRIITDLGVLQPDPETTELVLTGIYPGVLVADIKDRTGWDLRVSAELSETPEPPPSGLAALRRLLATMPARLPVPAPVTKGAARCAPTP